MDADDSTMFCVATCEELIELLCNELRSISDWLKENKLMLSASKTKCIVFGTRGMFAGDTCLDLSIVGTPLQQVRRIKLLGVIIDDGLT